MTIILNNTQRTALAALLEEAILRPDVDPDTMAAYHAILGQVETET